MLGKIIGVVLGLLLLFIGIFRPAFLWNFDVIANLRGSLGDLPSRILFIVAGAATLVSTLLLRKKD